MASILGPQFLGTLRRVVSNPPDWKDWKQMSVCIMLIILSPMYIYMEHLKFSYLELKLKLRPNDHSLILEKENLKRSLYMHVKLELGLETIYQLAGQLILLLLAYTETPTQNGLKSIFNDGLDPWSLLLLISSVFCSFYSCVSSHKKALTSCREHFPLKSQISSGLFSLFACLTRVTAIIIFFSGPLGLFSLLRHLQGEQYPWNDDVLDLVNPDGTIVIGNNAPFEWDLIAFQPKFYTDYVGIRLGYYLLIFFGILVVQMLVIFIAKCILSKAFWHDFNFLEKIIHSLENSNIPFNAKEWDDGQGDAKDHKKRMKSNWLEVLVVIVINAFFNSLLLLSLGFLGKQL